VEVATPAFFERFVKVVVMKQHPDEARVRKALDDQAPPVFDYLEGALGDREWFAGPRFSTADVAVASPFVNLMHVGEGLDAKRWPRLAAWLARTHGRPTFKALIDEERAGMPRG
jgi:glutathione S-transferase